MRLWHRRTCATLTVTVTPSISTISCDQSNWYASPGAKLSAEIAEKQARSIKYHLTIAKLPLAKDIVDFDFTGTPVNEALIRDLASGAFLAAQRNEGSGADNPAPPIKTKGVPG